MIDIDKIIEGLGGIARIIFYIIIIILLWQVLRAILGGTWAIEEIMLGLVILNLTATFTLLATFYNIRSKINGHIEWHRGYDKGKNENMPIEKFR